MSSELKRCVEATAPDGRRLVNIAQACALTGVTRRTIYNWMRAGSIEYVLTAGGHRRVYAESLFRKTFQS